MDEHRIVFDEIAWESPRAGMRCKTARLAAMQVRLMELTREFAEDVWCEKGHTGYVISGELEIDISGRVERFPAGSALVIPGGAEHAHKARAATEIVVLFLVEEVVA